MRIALLSDELTHHSLALETAVFPVTPLNFSYVFRFWKPDILLVESAWNGYKNRWKYKVASYQEPNRNNRMLQKMVTSAKKLGIPTVFWNKEDGIHFDRFIESAKLFDHIFTVDENAIEKYRAVVDKHVTVNTLMFAVQSKFHHFDGFGFKYNRANFAGSYSKHLHEKRRIWQDMMFEAAASTGLGVTVFDRNSDRKSVNYRYPKIDTVEVKPAVKYERTAQIYKAYALSLNVNTVENSATMFSRRLVEILACGGVAVTNVTPAVEAMFQEYCHVVSGKEEMEELFYRVRKFGLTEKDKEMARAGAAYVAKHHTWTHRLEEISKIVGV